ncbi:uncharacterized protein FOMMEDRAFT_132998 [Fomitiporia mediterranea MF3/22]|uniref:uncharacterized protein n=1 Tax=Fomitiporia mediterranea (strain MF3/22) TaxID=694068 RepID=UPI0004408B69|nr:uncharacterized protein FOMMEDRAFT_132998 [Fomitiporia mediterranea MF3/22]EJD03537.1 hypothetical protein FOMMEDRAFT_132998 [Fomitiporia mediterranea MF3/22]
MLTQALLPHVWRDSAALKGSIMASGSNFLRIVKKVVDVLRHERRVVERRRRNTRGQISLPTAPTLLNRQSSASITSYDSFPEQNAGAGPVATSSTSRNVITKSSSRPLALEVPKHARRRRDSTKPPDESKSEKRKKIIAEFYDTERAYVEGLELIYSHFLTPLIESLETPSPLLDREDLITVFSNFIDIWNLHRSFLTSLTELLSPSLSRPRTLPPPLSSVLVSHFPYLSLYTPFVSSFPEVMTRLSDLQSSNHAFDSYIKDREADERCGKLKLRDWLLTIVQRCPRYLLLLKDLISCTDPGDPERANLISAHSLLEKVTTSLDISLHTHAQTLTLLALQRATFNLPFQLVSPGRTLLKRGTLMQLDNSSILKERELLLFSDCLLWLANDRMIEAEWTRRGNDSTSGGAGFARSGSPGKRPEFKRSRSKSENELPAITKSHKSQVPVSPKKPNKVQQSVPEERWWFKGKAELVDIEVVFSSMREPGDERRLDILHPEMSFALYADNEQSRDDWVSAIRGAKASLLVSLHVMHPNSTLASSSSTNHIRRSLQALPYLPEEDETQALPKRGKVDHFVPAIWVPDGKTGSCMRCARSFGWRRRRHHCRLCGRVVCANCSEKTFFIADASLNDSSKSARACNACYDTVFPVIETSASENTISAAQSGSTLSSFPSWKTQKPTAQSFSKPSELMSLDVPMSSSGSPSRNVDVIRRPKARPLSHPVIPQVFAESFEGSYLSKRSEEGEDLKEIDESNAETDRVLEDISAASLNSPSLLSAPIDSIESFASEEVSPRARKRFSMPAIALQTTPVTTRPKVSGEGRLKRFSLVIGGKQKPVAQAQATGLSGRNDPAAETDLKYGIAAARLQELLERTSSARD